MDKDRGFLGSCGPSHPLITPSPLGRWVLTLETPLIVPVCAECMFPFQVSL